VCTKRPSSVRARGEAKKFSEAKGKGRWFLVGGGLCGLLGHPGKVRQFYPAVMIVKDESCNE
jgi:hypothetical protein